MLPPVLLRSCHLPPLYLMQKRLFSLPPDAVGFVKSCHISSGLQQQDNGQREPSRGNICKLLEAFLAAANTTEGLLKPLSVFCCGTQFHVQVLFSKWLIK